MYSGTLLLDRRRLMLRNKTSYLFRKLKLMPLFDWLYFSFNKIYFFNKNKRFVKEHPGVAIPPDYMLYESFRLDYSNYYHDGKETATWVTEQYSTFHPLSDVKILDWGCGPGRVVRHIPELLPSSGIYAADYNRKTIEWCAQNIAGVEFAKNNLEPPMPFNDSFFDFIYGLSVFTHLSLNSHYLWLKEIHRLLKPGGIFLFTTQGKAFDSKLSEGEYKNFSSGLFVVRDSAKEGHRSFSAFHPEEFIHSILSVNWKVLKFMPGTIQSWGAEQDTWIVQKVNGPNNQ